MRIFVLLLSLLLAPSFACNQSYEEIYGYKVGCPLESQTARLIASKNERQKEYTDSLNGQAFDSVEIETIDDEIGKLVFIKQFADERALNSELPKIINELQQEWGGSLDKDFISLIYSYSARARDSDALHTITVKHRDKLTYEIHYVSKKYVDYARNAMRQPV